jgi:cysteine-rich repeat protein
VRACDPGQDEVPSLLIPMSWEECDDGALREQDGCSASCERESSLSLFGNPQGGLVRLEIDGQPVEIATEAGQTTPQIIEALAARIALLGLPGVSAAAAAETLWTTAAISAVEVSDPGIATRPVRKIAVLPAAWLGLLGILLLAILVQRTRGSSSSQLR